MNTTKPFHTGICRWLTGWLALGLLFLINFQAAFISAALWIAQEHGHDHQIVVQSDGDHFDVRLSHASNHHSTEHQHEGAWGIIAFLFSTHDHDGNDHVLHFNLNEAPDQIRQRNIITTAATAATAVTVVPPSSLFPLSLATKSAMAILPTSPPPPSASLLGLCTTVLLI